MALLLAVVCVVLPVAWWQSTAAAGIALFAVYFFVRRQVLLLSPASIISIRLQPEEVVLVSRAGNEYAGRLARSTVVTPWLTVLNVRLPQHMRLQSVVIFPDSMEREDFRRLRVLLRWGELPLI